MQKLLSWLIKLPAPRRTSVWAYLLLPLLPLLMVLVLVEGLLTLVHMYTRM